MSELLDENLIKRKRSQSVYTNWSNIPAAVVILGALFKIMHWYGGDYMLLTGLSTHVGIELGFALVLKFRLRKNTSRLVIGTAILASIFYRWFMAYGDVTWENPGIQLITYAVVSSTALTYVLAKRRLRSILLKQ